MKASISSGVSLRSSCMSLHSSCVSLHSSRVSLYCSIVSHGIPPLLQVDLQKLQDDLQILRMNSTDLE